LWYGIIEDITEQKEAENLLNRRMEDLSFINTLNDAVNHGKSLAEITELIATETRNIFGSLSASIFLLDRDKKHLVLQHYTMSREIVKNLEKYIGMTIPRIHIPIGGNDHFSRVLNSDKGMLITGFEGVSAWLADFINTTFLSNMSRSLLRKIVPTATRLLKINSVISMSLKAGNEVLGVVELVSENTFDENILERFDNVRQQLSEIIFRRKVEQSLRESEENYRALSEASDAISSCWMRRVVAGI
jgi:PAS domain-containing protein